MLFRLAIATILATGAVSAAVDCANAEGFPSRTITLVVPFPAGGPTDTIGRIVAEGLQSALGQPVIVENVPGATGSIGTGRVARSEADGHTLILGTIATHVFNGAAYELKYDVVKDFEPISLGRFRSPDHRGQESDARRGPAPTHHVVEGKSGQGGGRHRRGR